MVAESNTQLFRNFESVKVLINKPDALNGLIFATILIIAILTATRKAGGNKLLDRAQTNQLKGLAILMVIVGHLWVHVAYQRAVLIFSGDAVAMFLILSGFGLTVSLRIKRQDFAAFIFRRVKRVMVPYWVATVMFLLLDYVLLNKVYTEREIVMTMCGLNFTERVNHIDYARWFVTFILMWYLVVYFAMLTLNSRMAIIFLFAFGTSMFMIHYYVLHLSWYQFLAFPLGCFFGVYQREIEELLRRKSRVFIWLSVLWACWGLAYKSVVALPVVNEFLWRNIPNVMLKAIFEFNGIVLCASVIIGSSIACCGRYKSKFLDLCGTYSYELYLIHGAFLIKYNFFIKDGEMISVLIGFSLLMFFLLLVSICLARASRGEFARR